MRIVLLALVVVLVGTVWADNPPTADKTKPPYERLLTGEDEKTALAFEERIVKLVGEDKYAEAVKAAEELAALRARVQGEDHWQTHDARLRVRTLERVETLPVADREKVREANEANRQGKAKNAKGQAAEVQPLYEKALDIYRKVLGEEHPDTAKGYNNLAGNLHAQGKYADAQPLFEKSLAIFRKVHGEEHPDTATAYNDLAFDLHAQGKYANAQPLFEKALALRRKVHGEEHPDTAIGYNNLAYDLHAQRKSAEAQPLYEKALTIFRKVRGEEHSDTAFAYNNLAYSLKAQGKNAEAQPLFEKALAILRKALGEEHPITALSYGNLASNLADQGKYAEAQLLYDKSLALLRKVQGEEHPSTAQGYNNLAFNLKDQARYAEAQPLYEKALAILRKVHGEQHPDTARCYNNLAFNLNAQGRYAEAQPLYEKSLAISRKVFGEDHPDTARGYTNLAANLQPQGQSVEAQPLFEKALAIYRKVDGEEHPDTAKCYGNLAGNLNAQARYAEAQPLFEKALAILRKVHGEEHPDTARCYNNLAQNLYSQGKVAEALRTLDQATRSYECRRLTAARGLDRSVATGSQSPYPLTAALLARQGRFPEAWVNLERNLARGLLDEQGERRGSTLTPDERSQRARLSDRLSAIRLRNLYLLTHTPRPKAEQTELDDLHSEQRRLETDLADLAVRLSKRELAELPDIRKTLPADTALVAWIDESGPGIEEHWVCLIRATGDPVWERLPGTGPQNQWAKADTVLPGRLRLALVGDPTTAPASAAEVAALARDLYAQRLAPLDKHLKGVKSLFVVPVNAMSGIPVEVLTDRYRISYVPSATYLARVEDRRRVMGDRVLALGDPKFDLDPGQLKPPPGPLPPGGLLVTQVVPTGNAAAARIVPDDVLLTYAGVDLKDVEQLLKLIADKANEKTVEITVWRDGKTAVRQVAAGRLGVVLSKDPAPQALAAKRKTDELLASVRGGEWKELPGTRVELARLADLFGKDKVTILADVGATEPALDALRTADRLKEFRYLHFATHGEANKESAFESRLILVQDEAARSALPHAGQPTLDGFLTAREVLEFWKLDAELVTLSACETALGREGGGEGALGFAQAFLTAGSRSVCLSLWKVDDAATALLMDRFYQNLTGKRAGLKGPLGKAAALAEARDWLRHLSLEEATERLGTITDGVARGKDQPALKVTSPMADPKANPKETKPFAHPRYWAAFVLIGDPN